MSLQTLLFISKTQIKLFLLKPKFLSPSMQPNFHILKHTNSDRKHDP